MPALIVTGVITAIHSESRETHVVGEEVARREFVQATVNPADNEDWGKTMRSAVITLDPADRAHVRLGQRVTLTFEDA